MRAAFSNSDSPVATRTTNFRSLSSSPLVWQLCSRRSQKVIIVSWPTGEFGGMGLEGAVRLGFKRELDLTTTPDECEQLEVKLVADAYHRGSAMNMASHVEIDDVIDPADTRHRLVTTLNMCPIPPARSGKKRPMIDTW